MQFAQLGGIERLVADDLCGYNSSVENEQVLLGTALPVKSLTLHGFLSRVLIVTPACR